MVIYVINNLLIKYKCKTSQSMDVKSVPTVSNMTFSSDFIFGQIVEPDHTIYLHGYVSLLSITMIASKPMAFVLWTPLYHSGGQSASERRVTSSFANLECYALSKTIITSQDKCTIYFFMYTIHTILNMGMYYLNNCLYSESERSNKLRCSLTCVVEMPAYRAKDPCHLHYFKRNPSCYPGTAEPIGSVGSWPDQNLIQPDIPIFRDGTGRDGSGKYAYLISRTPRNRRITPVRAPIYFRWPHLRTNLSIQTYTITSSRNATV